MYSRALAAISAALVAGSAHAALVTRTIDLSLSDSMLRTTTDSVGNVGMEFFFDADLAPFTVAAGDTLVTTLRFDGGLLIQGLNSPFWAFQGGATGLEPMNFSYSYADSRSGIGSNSTAIVSYLIALDIAGNVPTSFSGTTGTDGGGMNAAMYYGDLTNGSFLLRGATITTTVDSYQLVRGDGVFNGFDGSIMAERVSLVPVPEPPAWALVLSAIAALSVMRRTVVNVRGRATLRDDVASAQARSDVA